jgi:hypothetical protein
LVSERARGRGLNLSGALALLQGGRQASGREACHPAMARDHDGDH